MTVRYSDCCIFTLLHLTFTSLNKLFLYYAVNFYFTFNLCDLTVKNYFLVHRKFGVSAKQTLPYSASEAKSVAHAPSLLPLRELMLQYPPLHKQRVRRES